MTKAIFAVSILLVISGCDNHDNNKTIIKDSDGYKEIVDNQESNEKLKKISAGDFFTYNLQYVHHSNDQSLDKGKSTLDSIKLAFNNFPWIDQLNQLLNGKGETSPTFSIVDHLNKTTYAISLVGFDGTDYEYWMFYITEKNTVMKQGKTKDDVYTAIELFCKRQNVQFQRVLNKPGKTFHYTN